MLSIISKHPIIENISMAMVRVVSNKSLMVTYYADQIECTWHSWNHVLRCADPTSQYGFRKNSNFYIKYKLMLMAQV